MEKLTKVKFIKLIERAQKEDQAAWKELIGWADGIIKRAFDRWYFSDVDKKEIISQIYVKLFHKIEEIKDAVSSEGYFYAICLNTCKDMYNKIKGNVFKEEYSCLEEIECRKNKWYKSRVELDSFMQGGEGVNKSKYLNKAIVEESNSPTLKDVDKIIYSVGLGDQEMLYWKCWMDNIIASQAEIASLMEVKQSRVAKIKKSVLQKIKKYIKENGDDCDFND